MTSVRVVVDSLERFTEKLVKRLALNVTANLVETTPVDTGWARSNWVPSIGTPRTKVAGVRPAKRGEPGLDDNPQANGLLSVLGYKLGPSIFISNNVPYIKKLNAGTSTKAPVAFIQSAILRAIKQTVTRSR